MVHVQCLGEWITPLMVQCGILMEVLIQFGVLTQSMKRMMP